MSQKFICSNKSVFFSENSAELRASDLNFEYGYDKFFVYKCTYCNFYHLTTQKWG